MNISDTMAPANTALRNYKQMEAEAPDKIPYPTIQQPTADAVNAAGAQQVPTSMAEFYGRGGLTGTARQMVNAITEKRQKKALKAEYEKFLEAGERGADAAYRNEIRLHGDAVAEYLPEKTFFYDESGVFLPHQYAQALYVGVKKFQADQAKRQQNIQAGTIIGSAQNPQQASAGILQTGMDATPYEKDIGRVPTIQDQASAINSLASADKTKAETEVVPTLAEATISEKNANAAGKRTGGTYTEKLSAFNNSKALLMKQLDDVDKVYRDPITASNPTAITNAEKRRDQINKAIEKIDAQIARIEMEKYGSEIEVPQKDEASTDAITAAREIISGMERLPPKGMIPGKDEIGAPAYSRDRLIGSNTRPDAASYNTELAKRTVRYLDSKGISGIPDTAIMEMLKKDKLEDVIDDIFKVFQEQQGAGTGGTLQ